MFRIMRSSIALNHNISVIVWRTINVMIHDQGIAKGYIWGLIGTSLDSHHHILSLILRAMAGYSDIPVHAVHPSQLSAYSSLAGALTPATPISQFSSSTRERVPQTACKGVSDPVFAPIRFDYFSQARQGVALRDFSSRSGLPQLISGANEHVLAGIKIHKIDLRIMVTVILGVKCKIYLP